MKNVKSTRVRDTEVKQIMCVLAEYARAHPNSQIEAQRQNSVSIRIRVIDPDFVGKDRIDREPEIWRHLEKLPEEVFSTITMVLLLTPKEAKTSLASREFDDPIPSRL